MRYRLLAPVGVAGAIALAAWLPTVTSAAAATPSLAPISAQTLVAKALSSNVKGFSGKVRWTANLGLPSLSVLVGGVGGVGGQGGQSAFDPTSLLSGSHLISVWDGGPALQRLALPGSLSEVDIVHNGPYVYYYDSATQQVTRYTGAGHSGRDAAHQSSGAELTPDQAASKLLSSLDPSTRVTVVTPVYVAGQAAYQLVLTPDAANSTVGAVTIAIDAANGMPLRLQVIAAGAQAPAVSLGFTSISFSVPSASNFQAPHGATTVTKPISQALDATGPPVGRSHARHGRWVPGHRPPSVGTPVVATPVAAGAAPRPVTARPPASARAETVGSGWTTIAVVDGLNGETAHRLNQVSTAVSGSWGRGRLVTSPLINVLELSNGKLLVGFVTPAALETAASASQVAG